jgi:hypothetical protein
MVALIDGKFVLRVQTGWVPVRWESGVIDVRGDIAIS